VQLLKWECTLGVIGLTLLHFPPLVRVFYSQTYFLGLMCFRTPHLIMNPMLGLQQTRFFGLNIIEMEYDFCFLLLLHVLLIEMFSSMGNNNHNQLKWD
jgi:hypothetical protein